MFKRCNSQQLFLLTKVKHQPLIAKVLQFPSAAQRKSVIVPKEDIATYPFYLWPQLIQIDFRSEHNFYTGFQPEIINSCGIFIATHFCATLGEPMRVLFTVASLSPIYSAIGIVQWIREYSQKTHEMTPGIGLAFQQLETEAVSAILRFMQQREPIFWTE
jgi:Tfp pilus assembly protein PilZ